MERVFQISWEFSHYPNPRHEGVTFGKENAVTAATFIIDAQAVKAGKAAVCDEIRPEMSKYWRKKFFGCRLFVTWPGVPEGYRKIFKLGWPTPYTRRDTGVNAITTEAFLSLVSLEICMLRALKKEVRK